MATKTAQRTTSNLFSPNRQSQFDVLLNEKTRASRMAMQYPGSKKFKTVTISKTKDDQIPSILSPSAQKILMSNKMWKCEIVGNHLKAEYWRRKIEKIKTSSKTARSKKLEKFYENEFKMLQLEFDEKCREVVDFYAVEIGNLNESSIAMIDALKLQQLEDQRVLKYALKSACGNARINKRILGLRKIEYSLGQSQKFLEAQGVKEEIEALQKRIGAQYFDRKMVKDRSIRQQLGNQHKKEMKQLLNKLALKKTLLYNKLQRELKKLENWKATHDGRLDSHYKKDFLKLDGKLLAEAPRSHQNRIDHILHPDFEDVNAGASSFLQGPRTSKHALREYRRSQSLYDSTKELTFLEASKQALDSELQRKLTQNENKNKLRFATKGLFTQYIDGDDETHIVLVEFDDKKTDIRWKRKVKTNQEEIMEMAIECKMRFEDIFDIEAPSMSPFFCGRNQEKYGFDKKKCFSVYSTSIKLHLEAKSEKFMKHFATKLMDLVLRHQNRRERRILNESQKELKKIDETLSHQ